MTELIIHVATIVAILSAWGALAGDLWRNGTGGIHSQPSGHHNMGDDS